MNEFGIGKICDAHFIEFIEEYGDLLHYTTMIDFNDNLVCSELNCEEVPLHLVTIPKGARSHYGKKETKSESLRQRGNGPQEERRRQEEKQERQVPLSS
jgi:hypothetical protein